MVNVSELKNKINHFIYQIEKAKKDDDTEKLKKAVNIMLKNASKPDKTDLINMKNSEIFFILLILLNIDDYSYDETFEYVEEYKSEINSWNASHINTLLTLRENISNTGELSDYKYLKDYTSLGLGPIFLEYNTKNVFSGMAEFLRFKETIKKIIENTGNLKFKDKLMIMNLAYTDSIFSKYIETTKKYMQALLEGIKESIIVFNEMLKSSKQALKALDHPQEITEISDEWFKHFSIDILEELYEIANENNLKKYKELCETDKKVSEEICESSFIKLLYINGLDPKTLPQEKIKKLESIPKITEYIKFLKDLEIPLNNILTKYYSCLISLTTEKILFIKELIRQRVITPKSIKENISILDNNYSKVKANHEILKNIVDWNNIFYNDSILLKDPKTLKDILSVLKEYKLSKNNYIFLLCNYEYIKIYDLLLEHDIPTSLFINICKTDNPVNTIKRILMYIKIGEPFLSNPNELRKDITNPKKYICDDSSLDEYLPNYIEEIGMNMLDGTYINEVTNSPIVNELEKNYRVDDVYIIGNVNISRPKFLRNFESVSETPNLLIVSLVSSSILSEEEFINLLNALKTKELKK